MSTLETQNPYRWIIVALGALMTCVTIGAMFSLAVFMPHISAATGWTRAGISSAMTLNFLMMGASSFGWGMLTDRIGTRPVVLVGSIALGVVLVLASHATSLIAFQLAYGVGVGLAGGAFFAPMMAAVTGWFDKHRGLAVSLVSAGVGVAPATVSPFAAWLLASYDWRTAMMTIGLLASAILLPAAFFVRNAQQAPANRPASIGETVTVGATNNPLSKAFRSPQFALLAGTYFLCCAAHSGPIFHIMSYAITCGISAMTAVSIYSVEGIAGLGGRLLFGVAADRLGPKRVLVTGLLVQALVIAAYLSANQLSTFYVLAVVFGAAYGGVMPLYALLAREYFGQQVMGSVLGALTMASSFGMALGPVAGGWIFDRFDVYDWLFIGSSVIGIAAFLIALAFPRFASSENHQPAPA
ncbi:MFS transporter [Mesorhizobium sp. NPDC059054]|uniref:MFS transporter n=1 Tax=Mesorhizobium sp. NPDC059054 TaxID=3346711 RepID=UPI003684A608